MNISRSYLFPCPSPVWSLWVSSLSQTLPALVLSPNLKTLSHPLCNTDITQSLAIWPSKTVPSSMPSCPQIGPQFPRKPQAELAAKSMEGFGHVVGQKTCSLLSYLALSLPELWSPTLSESPGPWKPVALKSRTNLETQSCWITGTVHIWWVFCFN